MSTRYRLALVMTLFLALLACSTSTKPDLSIPVQDKPFYYYQDTPVYLDLDSSRVTVSTTLPMPQSALSVLEVIGVDVDSVTNLGDKVDNYIIWLSAGTCGAEAVEAARALRLASAFDFASNAYIYPHSHGRLLLYDELKVRFKEGTSSSEIARLNQRLGMEILRRLERDSLRVDLSYPKNSESAPLEIAAYYYTRPIVEYAEPGCYVQGQPWREV